MVFCALVIPAPLHAAPPAAAEGPEEPDDAVQRAMEAFQRGVSLYDQASYERALEAFLDASSLFPSPDFQFNIGNCYEKLEKFEDAIRAYRTYLRTKPDASDADEVKLRIEQLDERREQAAEQARREREAELAASKQTIVIDGGPTGRGLVIAGGSLLGIGAAIGVGGGVALGVLASQRSRAIAEVNAGASPGALSFAEARVLEQEGQLLETWQIAAAASGAGLAITGTIMLAVGVARKRDRARRERELEANAIVTPTFGANGVGLGITGRF